MVGEQNATHAAVMAPQGTAGVAGVALMVSAMTVFGLAPLLFGGLAEVGRLPLTGVGLAIPIQAFIMGAVNLGADLVLPRRRQRLLGLVCIGALATLQACTIGRAGTAVLVICALASVPQGLLLWIAMGVIARAPVPARLMAYSEIAITLLKLLASTILAAILIPRWGIDAGFAVAALIVSSGFLAALVVPDELEGGTSARRNATVQVRGTGWVALAVVMLVWNGTMSMMSYLLPLAAASGLSQGASHGSFVAVLIGQISGGVIAAILSKRITYPLALSISGGIAAGALMVFLFHVGAFPFWAASWSFGFAFGLTAPFLMPMLITADPTRQAAGKFMGAALIGSAVGPLITSRIVGYSGAIGAVYMGFGSVSLAFVAIVILQFLTARRSETAVDAYRQVDPA